MEFIVRNLEGDIVISNISDNKIMYELLSCDAECETVQCKIRNAKRRQGKKGNEKFIVYFLSYDQEITNRIFKHYFKVLFALIDEVLTQVSFAKNKEKQKTRRLKHNLINHNANILQEFYKLFSQDLFKNGTNHLDVIVSIIKRDIKKSAFTFLRILKYSNLMKAEFDVYDMLDQEQPYLDFTYHSLHRVVILTLNPFWLDLVENNVNIVISPCNDRILLDYKTISVALSHIFDNTAKYIMPKSDFTIKFDKSIDTIMISFDMISVKVEENELEKLFEENVSGKWAEECKLSGDGIGMYMVNKLIKLNKGKINFKRDVNKFLRTNLNGIPYENNIIEISLPLGNLIYVSNDRNLVKA